MAITLLAPSAARCGREEITLPSDQCMVMDKDGVEVSSLVDEHGNEVTLQTRASEKLVRRDASGTPACAYVICGKPTDKNHISPCKTGRKDPPPLDPPGTLPEFLKSLIPAQHQDMKVNTPTATIGIRG